jgi:hypothetical protein
MWFHFHPNHLKQGYYHFQKANLLQSQNHLRLLHHLVEQLWYLLHYLIHLQLQRMLLLYLN